MEEVTEVLRKCSRMVLTGNKKKPQVTKSGPDLSRKLLYLYMLLLKSVNIVLVSHRITGNERKIMPESRVPYDARIKVLTIQHNHTVQTADLSLPCIRRIPKMHSWIENNFMLWLLLCILGLFLPHNFTLSFPFSG